MDRVRPAILGTAGAPVSQNLPVTDPALAAPPAPVAPAPPGTVTAAAITTITAASITAAVTLLTAVGYALIGHAILEELDDTGSLIAWFFGIVTALLALCAVAVLASVGLLRRRRWAWWTLLALAPVTAVLGLLTAFYLLPLGIAAAAVAVFVLLVLPSTRTWLAASST